MTVSNANKQQKIVKNDKKMFENVSQCVKMCR